MEPMKLIGYIRVSTEDQKTIQQEDAIRGECLAHGYELVDIVTDLGASGKDLNRPGIQEALRRLQSDEADGLVVAKLDRLTRSVRDLGDLLERHFARPRGRSIALVSVAERIDTDHASGRLMLNVLMSVAQWERETIGERTRDALRAKRRRGERVGGIPYGYRLAADGVQLRESLKEQVVIAQVLKLHRDGVAQRRIVRYLKEQGYTGRTGKPLRLVQVQRILKRASAHVG